MRKPGGVVRVLTYNIHGGEGVDGKIDLERLARVIRNANPDLVALQEVDRNTVRSGRVDQAARLGELTGMHFRFAIAMPYDDGEYGELVLSRTEFLACKNYILPGSPRVEPRGAAEVMIEPGAPLVRVRFVATHLEHEDESARLEQVAVINDRYAGDTSTPTILAGDMNARPESPPMKELGRYWQDASAEDPEFTFPSPNPDRKIDYILFKPRSAFQVVETHVIDDQVASDHRPLLAVLRG